MNTVADVLKSHEECDRQFRVVQADRDKYRKLYLKTLKRLERERMECLWLAVHAVVRASKPIPSSEPESAQGDES